MTATFNCFSARIDFRQIANHAAYPHDKINPGYVDIALGATYKVISHAELLSGDRRLGHDSPELYGRRGPLVQAIDHLQTRMKMCRLAHPITEHNGMSQ